MKRPVVFAFIAGLVCCFSADAAKFRAQIISTVEGGYFVGRALNDSNTWAGYIRNSAGVETGYIGNTNLAVHVGSLGGGRSRVNGLSNRKWSVGSSLDTNGVERAFLFSDGYMEDLSFFQPPGWGASAAMTVDNLGHVTGWAIAPTGEKRAFTYSAGHWEAVPNFGVWSIGNGYDGIRVFGVMKTEEGLERGFVYESGRDLRYVGTGRSALYGLPVSGLYAVGDIEIGDQRVACMVRALHDDPGSLWPLGTLGGKTSKALAGNGNSHAVGESEDAQGRRRAFYYRNATMFDLNNLVDSREPILLTSAYAINNLDSILAEGTYAGEAAQFLLTIDEPFQDVLKFTPTSHVWMNGGYYFGFGSSGAEWTRYTVQVSTNFIEWRDLQGEMTVYPWGGSGPNFGAEVDTDKKFYRLKKIE